MTSSTVKGRVAVLACLAAAAAAGAAVLHTDALLSRGFGNALDASRPALSFETTVGKPSAQVGDEGYWLTRAEVESPTPFAKPLAIGDRITIAGRDGRQRQLEVVDLKAVGGHQARATQAINAVDGQQARTTQALNPRLLLVTCRVVGETTDRAEPTVRFIIEAEPVTSVAPTPAKAL
jgi:hypothetical protein